MTGPLSGIRIADFTFAWAGPHATELLGFMGAEVIKVESMRRPDHSRRTSLTTGQVFAGMNQSGVFNDINLNKLGVRLDLTNPKAVAIAKRLVQISDIAAQNMRPGVMERLGLGYEALRAVRPDLIYLSSSALGATGPERAYVGYAPSFASIGGLAYLSGYADGDPCQLSGEIDLISATTSAFAVLATLAHRQRTGQGQHIDLSSSEVVSVLIGEELLDYTMNGRVPGRMGNRDAAMAPHGVYPCLGTDKWLSIAVSSDEEWQGLTRAMGRPTWAADPRFATAAARKQHEDELDRRLAEWTRGHPARDLMARLQREGVPAAPSFDNQELYEDPHLRERGAWVEVQHPEMGRRITIAPPWKLSATPAEVTMPAPTLGQHHDYVFGELLGLSRKEMAELEREGVLY